jgi:replicative DNA helicase
MLNCELPVGLVSIEDGPDVVGSRLLAALTGVDSMAIRQKNLSEGQIKSLLKEVAAPPIDHMYFTYPLAGSIEDIEDCVKALGDQGCRLIFTDYVQKIRGHGKGDRRNEVAESFTRIQRAISKYNAAGIVVSQFRRLVDGEKVPQIYHLAESGDLEREARVIILAHKHHSPDGYPRVRFRLAKSVYGGEHVRFDMVRDESGTLRPAAYYDPAENF